MNIYIMLKLMVLGLFTHDGQAARVMRMLRVQRIRTVSKAFVHTFPSEKLSCGTNVKSYFYENFDIFVKAHAKAAEENDLFKMNVTENQINTCRNQLVQCMHNIASRPWLSHNVINDDKLVEMAKSLSSMPLGQPS